jgi:hypothetical protein
MGQRLVECVAAAGVVEGLDAQGHGGEPFFEGSGQHPLRYYTLRGGRKPQPELT